MLSKLEQNGSPLHIDSALATRTANPEWRLVSSPHSGIPTAEKILKTLPKWETLGGDVRKQRPWLDRIDSLLSSVSRCADYPATSDFIVAWLRSHVPVDVIDVTSRHRHLRAAEPQEWLAQLRETLPPAQPNYAALFSQRYQPGNSQVYFAALVAALPGEHFSEQLYKKAIVQGLPTEVRTWLFVRVPRVDDVSAQRLEAVIREYENNVLVPGVRVAPKSVAAVSSDLSAVDDESAGEFVAAVAVVPRSGATTTTAASAAGRAAATTNFNAQPTTPAAAAALALAHRQRANQLLREFNLCFRCMQSGHTGPYCPNTTDRSGRGAAQGQSKAPGNGASGAGSNPQP